jgi:hypothetical protein
MQSKLKKYKSIKSESNKGQCQYVRQTESQLSKKKNVSHRGAGSRDGSARLNSNKNLRSSSKKPSLSKHKNMKQSKVSKVADGRKMECEGPQTVNRNPRNFVGEEFKEYYGGIGKKKAASKMKKDLKSAWI